MTLSTHAVLGSAIAVAIPQYPVLGLTLAFASHFMLDSIPHWDYRILSQSANPENFGMKVRFDHTFFLDGLRIGSDALFGLVLAFFFFAAPVGSEYQALFALAGAAAAMLPDFLQFVYSRFPQSPIRHLQRFHLWIHTEKKLIGRPVVGIASQILVAVVTVLLFFPWLSPWVLSGF